MSEDLWDPVGKRNKTANRAEIFLTCAQVNFVAKLFLQQFLDACGSNIVFIEHQTESHMPRRQDDCISDVLASPSAALALALHQACPFSMSSMSIASFFESFGTVAGQQIEMGGVWEEVILARQIWPSFVFVFCLLFCSGPVHGWEAWHVEGRWWEATSFEGVNVICRRTLSYQSRWLCLGFWWILPSHGSHLRSIMTWTHWNSLKTNVTNWRLLEELLTRFNWRRFPVITSDQEGV